MPLLVMLIFSLAIVFARFACLPYQRNRYHYVIPLRAIGFRRGFLDPRDVHAFRGPDPDPEHHAT